METRYQWFWIWLPLPLVLIAVGLSLSRIPILVPQSPHFNATIANQELRLQEVNQASKDLVTDRASWRSVTNAASNLRASIGAAATSFPSAKTTGTRSP